MTASLREATLSSIPGESASGDEEVLQIAVLGETVLANCTNTGA